MEACVAAVPRKVDVDAEEEEGEEEAGLPRIDLADVDVLREREEGSSFDVEGRGKSMRA